MLWQNPNNRSQFVNNVSAVSRRPVLSPTETRAAGLGSGRTSTNNNNKGHYSDHYSNNYATSVNRDQCDQLCAQD